MKILKQSFTKHNFFPRMAIIVVIMFGLFAYRNLFHTGLLPTHDGEYHILRFYEFDKALRSGSFYPRWANDFNFAYGIPLFNFVYPFPNFIASFFHIFGLEFIDVFKIQLIIAAIIGGISMYLWSKELWGKLAGITSAILYMYAPYMFLDMFIRGSVGEVWALGLFPLFLWAITRYIRAQKKMFSICSLILALVIFSHNILALMFFIFSLFYISVLLIAENKVSRKTIVNVAAIYLLGLGLSAIFWLPALAEKQYVVGLDIFDIKNNFPDLFQLLVPSWGSGFSGGELQNQMSFQLGIMNIFIICIAFFSCYAFLRKKMRFEMIITLFFLLYFFIVVFLMLSSSVFVWEHIPLMTYFQFPWRFLSLEILICAVLGGGFLKAISSEYIKYLYIIFICIFSVLLTQTYNVAPYYHMRTDSYYTHRSNFIDSTNSPGNAFNTKWMKQVSKRRENIISYPSNVKLSLINNFYTHLIYKTFSPQTEKLIINIAYFPGWRVLIDHKAQLVKVTPQGTMEIVIPSGEHLVDIYFADTFIRQLSTLISVCALVFLLTHGTIKQTRIYENWNRY